MAWILSKPSVVLPPRLLSSLAKPVALALGHTPCLVFEELAAFQIHPLLQSYKTPKDRTWPVTPSCLFCLRGSRLSLVWFS